MKKSNKSQNLLFLTNIEKFYYHLYLKNLNTIQLEGYRISIGQWLLSKKDIQPCFFILTTQESMAIPFELLFIQISTYNWISYDLIKQEAHHPNFCKARVCIKSNLTNQIIEFNPTNFPNLITQSIWLYEEGYIYDLDFDPKE